jgi:hypothetical protein
MKHLLTLLLLIAALPLAAAPKKPDYRTDPRLSVALPGKPGEPLEFEQLEKALDGVPVMVAGVIANADIVMPQGKRTAREAFQSMEEFSLGHWERVGDAWVLVMERRQIEIGEMDHARQEQAAKQLLAELLAGLDDRRQGILLQGGALSQVTLTLADQHLLAELGQYGYWRSPYRVDPSATRGSGSLLKMVEGQVTVCLPSRTGRLVPWVQVPATMTREPGSNPCVRRLFGVE